MVAVLILIAGLAVAVASAEPVNLANLTHGSYVTVETNDGPVNITIADTRVVTTPSNSSIYIQQGEVVYLGDKLDISGVVPPYPQLAYWDGYDMYDTLPTYNITLPWRKAGWYNFTIDPSIFGTRLGNWYKYADKFERAGNNIAFTVEPRPFYNYTLTFKNGTMIYISELPDFTRPSPMITPKPEIMPQKHVADYLVTSNDAFNISISELSAVWIFDGEDNSILYSSNDTGQIVFNDTQISHLGSGDYKIIIQSMGDVSKNLDVVFADKKIKWFDRNAFTVNEIPTENLVPTEAIRNLERIFPVTRDKYKIKTLTVQPPEITIGYMSQISIGTAKEYYRDSTLRGNVSLMEMRGYTNTLPGTNLTITLDENYNNPREIVKLYTYPGKAQGSYLGDMRYYQIYVPLYWDDLKPGMHNLTARTEQGGYAVANFPVHEENADYCTTNPNECNTRIRFLGNRNPWAPNLTVPEPIVVVETKIVEKVIPITIAPSEAQITEAAQKIVDAQNQQTKGLIIIGVVAVIILAFLGWFGWSLWRAKRK